MENKANLQEHLTAYAERLDYIYDKIRVEGSMSADQYYRHLVDALQMLGGESLRNDDGTHFITLMGVSSTSKTQDDTSPNGQMPPLD